MFSIRFIRKYLSHQILAKSAHGIHSPFVFTFYTKLLHGKSETSDAINWEQLRAGLKADHTMLDILDLGAGSLLHHSNERKISQIASNALKPPRLARFLYRLSKFQQPDVIIELGTSLGITSLYLAGAAPDARLITIEGSPSVVEKAAMIHQKSQLKNITILQGSFDKMLPNVITALRSDNFLLYVDGNHQKDATLRYFEWALEQAGENTVMVFDDIHWSEGMEEAWSVICSNKRVTLTIDMFFMGIVYFKKSYAPEHYKLRYA